MILRVLVGVLLAALAAAAIAQAPLPSLEELEGAGVVIGEIRVVTQDVFDLSDPKEDNWLFRLANNLHVQTHPGVIRGQLLFHSGERLSVQKIQETERLLRGNSYLYEVHIRPVALHDGVVDLEVVTRDTWSLELGGGASYAGGTTTGSVKIGDRNLLGTGISLGIGTQATSEVSTAGGSRRAVNVDLNYPYAMDGHTILGYTHSTFSEGSAQGFTVTRPFYHLDARWAGDLSAFKDSRFLTRYADGSPIGRFQRVAESANLSGGWSRGLIDGWTHRFTVGLRYLQENYSTDPLDPAPPPGDRTLYTPYFHYQVVQDDYRQTENVNSIGRPEYQQLGMQFNADIGQSLRRLGSTESVTQYGAGLSGGLRFSESQTLLASGGFSGEYGNGESDNLLLSGSLTYYQRRRNGALLYLALQGDATDYSDDAHYLSLGGETGLRGYPTNYRLGERRVLFTAEQRFYSDWYPFQLIRVGGAVFYDVGRAWGGPYDNNGGQVRWYADAGFGLRLLSARSARGQTLHIDLAFPLHHDPTIKAYQLTIESKTSF
ncbi:MAG TPA: hypothetical protein VFV84_10890 [Burkholderiales bacterium]|nr:hypothetical protein [Burkholderiales bacterium]